MILYLIKGDVQLVDAKVGQQTFFLIHPPMSYIHKEGIYLVLVMLCTLTYTRWSTLHRITILLAYIILHKQAHTVL